GDLESRLGNIDAARQHYDAALPLYEAEQARLGKANTLQSLGDLESRLGNIDAARQHYEDALKLYRLEREPGGIINTFAAAKWAWRKPTKRCTRRPMTPLLRPSLRCSRWTA
ncbi:MAG: tetratricopeptide repeat protein, partial [Anaerolineae bacterium]